MNTTIQELLDTYTMTLQIVDASDAIVSAVRSLPDDVRIQALDIALSSTEGLFSVANQLKGQL